MHVDLTQFRVLHLLADFQPRGYATRLLGLCDDITQFGPSFEFLACQGKGSWRSKFLQRGPTWALGDRAQDLWRPWRLWNFLQRIRPDLIHFWGLFPPHWISLARWSVPNSQIVATLGDRRSLSKLAAWHNWPWTKACLPDQVVVESEGLTQSEFTGSHSLDLQIIPALGLPVAARVASQNAVEQVAEHAQRLATLRHQLNVPPDARILLTVGPLTSDKRFVELLWALDQVNCVLPHVYLLIVGTGPAHEQIEHYSRLFRVSDRVRLLGEVTNLAEYYQAAEVYLTADLQPGPKQSLLEAQSYGLPIVGQAQPALRELCLSGEDSLLSDPQVRANLAGNLYRLLNDPACLQNLRQGAWVAAQRRNTANSWEAYRSSYEKLYHDLTAVRTIPLGDRDQPRFHSYNYRRLSS